MAGDGSRGMGRLGEGPGASSLVEDLVAALPQPRLGAAKGSSFL